MLDELCSCDDALRDPVGFVFTDRLDEVRIGREPLDALRAGWGIDGSGVAENEESLKPFPPRPRRSASSASTSARRVRSLEFVAAAAATSSISAAFSDSLLMSIRSAVFAR